MGKTLQMILVLGAAAALAYVLWKQSKALTAGTPTTSPVAPNGGGDLYSSILGAATGIIGVFKAAQTTQSTN